MCSEPGGHRTRTRRLPGAAARLALILGLGLVALGCGNKKPPKAPPRIVAAATTDLAVSQRGLELQFSLAYPAVTEAGLPLPGLEAVELWRMTRPLGPRSEEDTEGDEEVGDEATEEAEEPAAEESAEEEPPAAAPFLFRRPVTEVVLQAEERIQVDPREFAALAELELRIEGVELAAAVSGDRLLLRLPLAEPPPADVPEEERELEIFGVRTISSRGLESQFSNLVKILPRTPPPPPRQIETRPGADGVDVAWRADDPAVGFRVYRRDAASRLYGTPIAQPLPEARTHLDRGAAFDSSYVYSVTTVALESPLVESALAGEREVQYEDRYPPRPPTGLIAFAEPGRARLLWEPSSATDLAGYLVYRRGADGSGFDRLTAEPGLELEYLDTAVTGGRAYSYYVSAVDTSGNESEAGDTVDVEIP